LEFGQHALMENAGYDYAFRFKPVKQYVAPVLHAAQAASDLIARAAQLRLTYESPATCFEAVNVTDSLIQTPGV
jgi:hypothetical protein